MKKPTASLKELLEAGAHFGHQVRRWNPKMKPYIYCVKDGVHIFDLAQTAQKISEACEFIESLGSEGKTLVFVGTKGQAKKIVEKEAVRCGAKYVSKRWLGGLITNFGQVSKNIKKMVELREKRKSGEFKELIKKEQLLIDRDIEKLESFYGGLEGLDELPEALFVIDAKKQVGAIKEACKKQIPVVAVCDSNVGPEGVDFVVPGNDDAVKAIKLYCRLIADAYLKGRQKYQKKHSNLSE